MLNSKVKTVKSKGFVKSFNELANRIGSKLEDISSSNATSYDAINPDHYKKYSLESIQIMESAWGPEKVAVYCEITAFKYRMRMGNKPTSTVSEDLKKEEWYLRKAKEMRSKIDPFRSSKSKMEFQVKSEDVVKRKHHTHGN